MKSERQIIFYENHFTDFYLNQSEKIQEKIEYVFMIIKNVQNIPKKFLDHLTGTDGLYEIRIESDVSSSFGPSQVSNSQQYSS